VVSWLIIYCIYTTNIIAKTEQINCSTNETPINYHARQVIVSLIILVTLSWTGTIGVTIYCCLIPYIVNKIVLETLSVTSTIGVTIYCYVINVIVARKSRTQE
jgi:hypothetical protein